MLERLDAKDRAVLGVHRFYVGKVGTGILLTIGGLAIRALIDW